MCGVFVRERVCEQSDVLRATIASAVCGRSIEFADAPIDEGDLRSIERVQIVAEGPSHDAGVDGRRAFECWAKVEAGLERASDLGGADVGPRDLVIGITRSGETAATIAAMRRAHIRGARVLALTNARGSEAARGFDGVIYTRPRSVPGIATTEAFTAQLATLYLLALKLASVRGAMSHARWQLLLAEIEHLPELVESTVAITGERVAAVADRFDGSDLFIYLGRRAESARLSAARARGAHVIAIVGEGPEQLLEQADEVIHVPRTDSLLTPLLAMVPVQLLATEMAGPGRLVPGQSRDLEKSVAVE